MRRAALASLFALAASPALGQPIPIERPSEPRPETQKLEPPEARALLKDLEAAGKVYGDAKKALGRGKPDEALRLLKKSKSELLADREALLRGDALLALGQKGAAEEAYRFAHEKGEIDAVKLRAARGLANVYGQLQNKEAQLASLEELLEVRGVMRRPQIMLERAEVLLKLGRTKEAIDAALRVASEYPSYKVAGDARAMVERLTKKGSVPEASTGRVELARIQNLIRSGETSKAKSALDELEKKSPEMRASIGLTRADAFSKDRDRLGEIGALKALLEPEPDKETLREVLDRLGRTYMAIDMNDDAIHWFDVLKDRFPHSKKTVEAQFLAAWLPYNSGQYLAAADRFLKFASEYKKWHRRPEALWFAGWSAYLGHEDALARRAFAQLLEEHPQSDMALFAHYWTGRIKERAGEIDDARTSYRNVLRMAPLSYQAAWAEARLDKLGERVAMEAPKTDRPASLEQTLCMLGTKRPRSVDRGIALQRGNVDDEAYEELDAASEALADVKDTRGRVMIAEMLAALGAHNQAFRMASRITAGGADLLAGEPYAWRAWRLAFPKAFEDEVKRASEAHGIDPLLVLSIMRTESVFQPGAKSPVGARGLMQLMPGTAKRIGQLAEGGKAHASRFVEPESNIWLGAWYLKQLLDRYDGQIALAAGAYNAGPGAMDRWVENGRNMELDAFIETVNYRETRQYIRRVLETYQIYRRLDAAPGVDLAWVVNDKIPKRDSSVAF
ncbi:MAG: transglycosylase SLT domain-containing protein [Myxococcota bacterium]